MANNGMSFSNRLVVHAVVAGVSCFLALIVSYGIYIHYNYGGMPHASFYPSTMWGTTQAEKDAGWLPVMEPPDAGWDGQFYFRQSTDPFLNTDSVQCSDNVSYRYQRNGIPILAWSIAKCIGQYPTSGWLYQGTQFALIGLGFGVLVYWLGEQKLNRAMALAWLLCGGFFSLFHGLPDVGADAMFIVSCVCLMKKRLWLYSLSTSLLLMCREGYAIFAATVFVLSVIRWIDWDKARWLRVAVATALPGVVVVGWACYVGYRLGKRPMSGPGEVPWGFLVDWPFRAYFRAMALQWESHASRELGLKTICVLTILIVMLLLIAQCRRWVIALALLPYVILISMTGFTIWENESGYPKATSAILLIAMFAMPQIRSALLRTQLIPALMLVHLLLGVQMFNHFNVRYQGYLHQDIFAARKELRERVGSPEIPKETTQTNDRFERMTYALEVAEQPAKRPSYQGLFRRFHREPRIFTVKLTNTSETKWLVQPPGSAQGLALGSQLISDRGKIVHMSFEYLDRDVAPGESVECLIAIPYPSHHEGHRILIGLAQTGGKMFLEDDGGQPFRSAK